jgi:hypothetical protein
MAHFPQLDHEFAAVCPVPSAFCSDSLGASLVSCSVSGSARLSRFPVSRPHTNVVIHAAACAHSVVRVFRLPLASAVSSDCRLRPSRNRGAEQQRRPRGIGAQGSFCCTNSGAARSRLVGDGALALVEEEVDELEVRHVT